jgi:hypothetical protein
MDVVAVGAARAGSALARPLLKKLGEKLLGTQFERQLSDACAAAIRNAVCAVATDEVSDDNVDHTVGLLRVLLAEVRQDPIDLILMTDGFSGWQEAADQLGLDLATLSTDSHTLIQAICEEIPREIARQAAVPDSPLLRRSWFSHYYASPANWTNNQCSSLGPINNCVYRAPSRKALSEIVSMEDTHVT